MDRTQATTLRNRFATNLKNARSLTGMTQADLAEAAGMHTVSVQSFERRINSPTLDSLELLARALGVEPQVLILTPAEALAGMTHLADRPADHKSGTSQRRSRGRVTLRQ